MIILVSGGNDAITETIKLYTKSGPSWILRNGGSLLRNESEVSLRYEGKPNIIFSKVCNVFNGVSFDQSKRTSTISIYKFFSTLIVLNSYSRTMVSIEYKEISKFLFLNKEAHFEKSKFSVILFEK